MLVECTRPWWRNNTYYESGAKVEVPEGTPIPSGFIVDGKVTPTKAELKAPKLDAKASELEAQSAAKEPQPIYKKRRD